MNLTMINHEKKLIFIHPPRTAGNSIEYALGGEDVSHITATEARKMYGEEIWNSYIKFSTARNPWDRVISMWATKWYHKDISKMTNDIRQFILQLKPYPHEHGLQCSDYINEEIDYIIRFENLSSDFSHIMKIIGCDNIKLPHISKTKRNNYNEYYNKETKMLISKMFKDDIKLFNYKFDM